ncbi:sensor domain-containing diguanylate cyclase [Mobilibacterium timonense]|uniref:sensor domain-containing diguanylate cyclase n=1 Tax=Mobilibacterium timonense TaxID=1871012 RepID=UPI0009852727|nr:sensor domain-containing diguanylate cyclase [Mobilibacterium timonense]
MNEIKKEKESTISSGNDTAEISSSLGAILPDRDELFRILDDLPFGCYVLSPDQMVHFWNREASKLIGYAPGEVIGKRCAQLPFSCSFVSGDAIPTPSCPAILACRSKQVQTMKMFMRKKNGDSILIRNTVIPLKGKDGGVSEMMSLFIPVTEDPYNEDLMRDIYEVATRDPVTCLPGRKYMESYLSEELERYKRTGHPFAVMYTDVDRFHDVNNQYGHSAGDDLLKEFGFRLRHYGRRTDRFCRWGGDEFVGVLQLKSEEDVRGLAQRFLQLSKNTEIVVDGQSISCRASIGITVVRENDDVETVVARADKYMFLAKEEKGDRVVTDEDVL